MGCAASKVEQEDTVRHCKERCGHMKDAVVAQQLLAFVHADYLRDTAIALSHFAQGHPSLTVSHHTAPRPPHHLHVAHAHAHAARPLHHRALLPPAPTPLPQHHQLSSPPQQPASVRAPWVQRLKVPHILSDSSVASPVPSEYAAVPLPLRRN